MLRFIKRSMQSVPYLSNLEEECMYDIIYSLETQKKSKGEILQRRGDDADELYFLQSGIIEVYTQFENKEFVLERLFRGSIINYRTFFMEERGVCGLRFAAPSILKALHKVRMNQICEKYPKSLGKTFNQYKFKISKEGKAIPLDYVMVLPSRITDKIKQTTRKKMLVGTEYKREFETRKAEFQRTQGRSMTEDEKRKYLESYIPNKQVTQFMQKAFYLENVLKNETIR